MVNEKYIIFWRCIMLKKIPSIFLLIFYFRFKHLKKFKQIVDFFETRDQKMKKKETNEIVLFAFSNLRMR